LAAEYPCLKTFYRDTVHPSTKVLPTPSHLLQCLQTSVINMSKTVQISDTFSAISSTSVAHRQITGPKACYVTIYCSNNIDWKSKALVKPHPLRAQQPGMQPLYDVQQKLIFFIFSRDNLLSNASNLLPTDPITASYALPGSSISTWQVGGFEGGIMPAQALGN
jgi:hypothetical protein